MRKTNVKISKTTAELIVLFGITFILYGLKLDLPAGIVFCIGLIVLLWKSWNKPELLAISLIILETRAFGAGPDKIFGILPEKIEIVVLVAAWTFWGLKGFCNRKKIPSEYTWLLYTLVIIIDAAIMGYITVGQPILFGILLQTRLLIIFSVFPIVALMKGDLISFERLWTWIKTLAVLQACINIIQFFLYPNICFLTITNENIRFGSIRITYGYMLITIAFLMAFSDCLKKLNAKNCLCCLIYLIDLLFVCKTRMVIFGIAVSALFALLSKLKYKSGWKKIVALSLIGGTLLAVMSGRITDLIDLTRQEVSTNSGNYVARTDEVAFYTSQVSNPLFGRGYISPKTAGGELFDTKYGYFSLTDIGIFGLYTTNGILGVFWFFSILLILIKKSYRSPYRTFGIEYVVYSTSVCLTLLPFYYSSEYLIIVLILLADGFKKKRLQNKESII